GLTRERVRQMEMAACEHIRGQLVRRKGQGHPAARALAANVRRLGFAVLDAASQKQGMLRRQDAKEWMKRVLPPHEAFVLWLIDHVMALAPSAALRTFDWFEANGRELDDGRTTLQLTEDNVRAVSLAFRE